MNNETMKKINAVLEELKSKADIMYDKIQERESVQEELSYKAKKNLKTLEADYNKLEEEIVYYLEELDKLSNLESRINLFDNMILKASDSEKEELTKIKDEIVKEYNNIIDYHASHLNLKKEESTLDKENLTKEESIEAVNELKNNSNEVANESLNEVEKDNTMFNFEDEEELDKLIDESINDNRIEDVDDSKKGNVKDLDNNVKNKKHLPWKNVIAGVLAITIVGNLVSCMKKNKSVGIDPIIPNNNEDSLKPDINENDSISSNNIKDLINEISKFDANLSDKELELKAENLVRVYNGELPLDLNDNIDWEPSTLAEYDEIVTDYACKSMDEDGKEFNYSYLVEKDTNEYKFISKYDNLYKNIKDSKSESEAYDLMVKLGSNMYDDWIMGGYENGINPYVFNAGSSVVALDATLSRYFSTVVEYENSTGNVVCVPVCHDYSSGATMKIPAGEIFDALAMGEVNNAALMQHANGGGNGGNIVLSEEFYNNLNKNLEQKYNAHLINDSIQKAMSK